MHAFARSMAVLLTRTTHYCQKGINLIEVYLTIGSRAWENGDFSLITAYSAAYTRICIEQIGISTVVEEMKKHSNIY